jgi:hypothetical protein
LAKDQGKKEEKMMRFGMLRIVVVSLFVTATVSAALAVDSGLTRQTLKGLPGVYVVVEEMQPNIEKHAKKSEVTKLQLQADTERRLVENGVLVLLKDEWLKTPGKPVLYVGVNTHETERYWYAYDIRVEIQQIVYMEANPKIQTLATTWSVNMTGMTNIGKLDIIRSDTGVLVGKFVEAFKGINDGKIK